MKTNYPTNKQTNKQTNKSAILTSIISLVCWTTQQSIRPSLRKHPARVSSAYQHNQEIVATKMQPTDITQYYLFKKLTPIRSFPNSKAIINLKCQIYANEAAVESDLTTVHDHGRIGQIMSEEEHEVRSPGVPFVAPNHPKIWPPPGQSAPINADYTTYKEQLKNTVVCKIVNSTLRVLVVEAIPDCYIKKFQDKDMGTYAGVTVQRFIKHLEQTCGHMSTTALEEEKKVMEELLFDPDAMEVQEVITELREILMVASVVGNAFTPEQLIVFGAQVFWHRCFSSMVLRVIKYTNSTTIFGKACVALHEISHTKSISLTTIIIIISKALTT